MKIAILGTRGIPNEYGGFEQFAERLSVGLAKRGDEVFVYSPKHHSFKGKEWRDVKIIHKHDPVKLLKSAGQFIYDLFCIFDSRKHKFDIIYQLGYTSSSVWFRLHPKKTIIITNLDGFEYKRAKYNFIVKRFLRLAENLAIKHSNILVVDSVPIKDYVKKKFNVEAKYFPYGSDIFNGPDESIVTALNLKPNQYCLLIGRFQTDNNIETIIKAYLKTDSDFPLVLIGNYKNAYGEFLVKKYMDDRIMFLGPVYDKVQLNNLRFYSNIYFHGHSAGGTNPSLLEAMGASCLICAHNNPYNKDVLKENAFYFNSEADIANLLKKMHKKEEFKTWIDNNLNNIKLNYNWNTIIETYYRFFQSLINID